MFLGLVKHACDRSLWSRDAGADIAARSGQVAEWFKAAVLKTAVGESLPWVRIPPCPPAPPCYAGRMTLRPLLRSAALAACLAFAAPALANDTSAELAAGGLVLTKTDAVAMRSEDLYISAEAVRVRYVFENTSGKDVTLRVAFPMPDIGGDGFFMHDVSIPVDDPANILGFTTRVDGKPVRAQVEQKAFASGVDRTAWLVANKIPLALHQDAAAAAMEALPAAKRKEAIDLGLYDEEQGPVWVLKTTYHWLQAFPAGRPIVVEHAYTPSVGATVATSIGSDYGQETRAKYCVDPDLERTSRRLDGPGGGFVERWIEYVLVTGGNWSRPIGDFRLVVDKGAPQNLVSFCLDGVKKIGPTQFEVRRKNWRPDRDLSILLLERREP